MSKKFVFATNNQHKIEEISEAIGGKIKILSLKDIQCFDEIPETGDTLERNAFLKANHVYNQFGLNSFADDTGLEVDALDGRPGVYSARYAGEHCSFDDNINKLLSEIGSQTNRGARFRTVICLIINGKTHYFEGSVEGEILRYRSGNGGFGYDPVFKPIGFSQTFAEMPLSEKNAISHRGIAVQKLLRFLTQL